MSMHQANLGIALHSASTMCLVRNSEMFKGAIQNKWRKSTLWNKSQRVDKHCLSPFWHQAPFHLEAPLLASYEIPTSQLFLRTVFPVFDVSSIQACFYRTEVICPLIALTRAILRISFHSYGIDKACVAQLHSFPQVHSRTWQEENSVLTQEPIWIKSTVWLHFWKWLQITQGSLSPLWTAFQHDTCFHWVLSQFPW